MVGSNHSWAGTLMTNDARKRTLWSPGRKLMIALLESKTLAAEQAAAKQPLPSLVSPPPSVMALALARRQRVVLPPLCPRVDSVSVRFMRVLRMSFNGLTDSLH